MHKDKIICGITTEKGITVLNTNIDNATKEGYEAIDISGTGNPAGEVCVLLCKKTIIAKH